MTNSVTKTVLVRVVTSPTIETLTDVAGTVVVAVMVTVCDDCAVAVAV